MTASLLLRATIFVAVGVLLIVKSHWIDGQIQASSLARTPVLRVLTSIWRWWFWAAVGVFFCVMAVGTVLARLVAS